MIWADRRKLKVFKRKKMSTILCYLPIVHITSSAMLSSLRFLVFMIPPTFFLASPFSIIFRIELWIDHKSDKEHDRKWVRATENRHKSYTIFPNTLSHLSYRSLFFHNAFDNLREIQSQRNDWWSWPIFWSSFSFFFSLSIWLSNPLPYIQITCILFINARIKVAYFS